MIDIDPVVSKDEPTAFGGAGVGSKILVDAKAPSKEL